MWYLSLFCSLLFLVSLVPSVPWRYAQLDAAMGNRFSMQRYYSLMGATDSFGSRIQWLSLSKKIQRKVEEFTRPSPLNILVGTVSTLAGAGGAAAGCSTWEQCKNHIKFRYNSYYQIGIVSIMSMILILFAAGGCIGVLILYSFEDNAPTKKKKKKKKEENPCDLSPKGKTTLAAMLSCGCSFIGTVSFVVLTDVSLQNFKNTAHYPYASSHVGAYAAGVGTFIMFFISIYLLNRVKQFSCCGPKKAEEEDEGQGEQQYNQYGPPGTGHFGGKGGVPGYAGGDYGGGGYAGGSGW